MKYPLWKPLLIVALVLGCASMIWLKGLNAGIDLAGGTTLTYAVQVPENENASEVIEQTIEILKERVDPSGVMNLNWRAEAGNRITVQMAQAPPTVGERRRAYEAAREQLISENLSERGLRAALQLGGAERDAALDRLSRGNADLRAELARLVELDVKVDQLDAERRAAEQTLEEARQSAGDSPDAAAQERLNALQQQADEAGIAFLDARDALSEKLNEVIGQNITGRELQRMLELTTRPGPNNTPSPRQQALDELKQQNPAKATELDELMKLYREYEQVKGPLDDPNDLIRLLQGAGVLEFRIAALPNGTAPIDLDAYVQRLDEQGPRAGRDQPYRWFEVQALEKYFDDPADRAMLTEKPELAGEVFAQRHGVVGRAYGGSFYVLLGNSTETALTGNDDWEVSSVGRTQDELGRPAVVFGVDPRGAQRLGNVTGNHVGRQMGIVLDGQLISSPVLRDRLSSGGTISGDFGAAEVRYLLNTLRAGSLGAILSEQPIAIKSTGPQLGQDNLNAGLRAAVLSLVVVSAFMIVYYLGPGIIAVAALLSNMVIILGVLSLTEATFTLPGIAGMVLTIGMAVDANVLIFERIREEMARKPDLPSAVRLGFGKALSAILDSNITSLITCIVLYYTATAEIKGFAVVLGVGILATMFCSIFITRVVIDLLMAYGRIKKLPMLPSSVPAVGRALQPNIDWLKLGKLVLPLSLVTIIVGLGMVYTRGVDMLDIEFRSGTEVTFNLARGEAIPIAEARERLEQFAEEAPASEGVDWRNLAEASVVTVGDTADGKATGFTVATLIEDPAVVSSAIKQAFDDVLDTTAPIAFKGEALNADAARGIVEPVRSATLGDNIGRDRFTQDVGDYLGGVVLVLDELNPPASVEDVTQRIQRMRRQPGYEGLGYRRSAVFGLESAGVNEDGQPLFSSLAVVSTDGETNYVERPASLTEPEGLAATEWALVKDAMASDTSLASVSNFSSQVSGTMQQRAIVALSLSLVAIVVYIALRFGSVRYSFGAAMSLVHDVALTIGVLAICGWVKDQGWAHFLLLDNFKINLGTIAALLTLIGYSLNDTIVVYDRIRETRGRLARASPAMINDSINHTFSRTTLTSGTTMLAVVILYIFGGPGVHGFAFTMMIGVAVGTFSSVAIAAPLLLLGYKEPDADKPVKTTPAADKQVPAAV